MDHLSERTWVYAGIAVMLLAAFFRLYDLALVPLHHDEGVNGNFLVRLVRSGEYQYDPSNYHGPTLYYFTAIIGWIIRGLFGEDAQNAYGLNTVTIRTVTALFGLGTVGLALLMRRRLGNFGGLSAAALLAVSPGAVYLSRYYIHETLFAFFTMSTVVAFSRYFEGRHPVYLILAAISLALLFATKETAFISLGVLAIALVITLAYRWWWRQFERRSQPKKVEEEPGQRLAIETLIWAFVAVAVFVAVYILFYASFFKNYPKGLYDSLKTFEFWTRTGTQHHVHPAQTYLRWLFLQETPILLSAIIGAGLVVLRPRNSLALFCALWAFGMLAAYTLVPYKTPWLTLNFIVPLSLIGGYAFNEFYQSGPGKPFLAIGILVLALCLSGYKSIDLNFFNYDNDNPKYVYVYAHTRRELLELVHEIDKVAKRSSEGGRLGITIVAPDYWPLPWYFRDYGRVGYFGRMTSTSEPIIIAAAGQKAEIERMFGDRYRQVKSRFNPEGTYALRPGVELLLYVRADLADAGGTLKHRLNLVSYFN